MTSTTPDKSSVTVKSTVMVAGPEVVLMFLRLKSKAVKVGGVVSCALATWGLIKTKPKKETQNNVL